MSANDRQIGGDHYKKGGEEHWDRVWRLYGRGYFVGCATKYLERYHEKNGVQDLEKAKHYIDKLIELETENDRTIICLYCEAPKQEDGTIIHEEDCPEKPSIAKECSWCNTYGGHLPDCLSPEAAGGYISQDR